MPPSAPGVRARSALAPPSIAQKQSSAARQAGSHRRSAPSTIACASGAMAAHAGTDADSDGDSDAGTVTTRTRTRTWRPARTAATGTPPRRPAPDRSAPVPSPTTTVRPRRAASAATRSATPRPALAGRRKAAVAALGVQRDIAVPRRNQPGHAEQAMADRLAAADPAPVGRRQAGQRHRQRGAIVAGGRRRRRCAASCGRCRRRACHAHLSGPARAGAGRGTQRGAKSQAYRLACGAPGASWI